MNIVIITGKYYPVMGPSSACIEKYVELLKHEHKIQIISQKGSFDVNGYEDADLKIICVSNWLNDLRLKSIWNINRNKYIYIYKFLLYVVRVIGGILGLFVYPTRRSWLIKKYYKCLCDIEQKDKVDVIISVSNPVCSHLAAQKFKKSNNSCKWITYTTDPFTFYDAIYKYIPFKRNRRKKNFVTEKKIYNSADYCIFTEELYSLAINEFGVNTGKVICFPYVLSEFSSIINKRGRQSNKTQLIYAGALNKAIRNPEFPLSIISQIADIDCVFYQAGDCDDILQKFANSNIIIKDTVKRLEYLHIICNEADILLNIGNNSSLQAPSKLLELLSTGLPIVNFYYFKNSQYELIEKYPLGLNISRDDVNAKNKLTAFIKEVKGRRLDISMVKTIFPQNTMEIQYNVLKQLIK